MTDFCYLEVLEGLQAGQGVVLDARFLYEVGSGEDCHLVLTDSGVEEVHAQFYVEAGQLVVVPLSGETRVNDHSIEESVFLVAGDWVSFGSARLSYEPLETGADPAPALSDTFMGEGADTQAVDPAALAETGVFEGDSPTFFDLADEEGDDWDLDQELPGLDRDHQAVVERLRLEAAELRIKLAAAHDELARLGGGGETPLDASAERARYEESLAEARQEAEAQGREVSELKELLRAFGQRARRERTTFGQRNQDLEARVRQLSARCQSLLNQAKRADSGVVERGAPKAASGTIPPQPAPRKRKGAVSLDSILERADARAPAPAPAPGKRKGAVSLDSIFDRAANKDPGPT